MTWALLILPPISCINNFCWLHVPLRPIIYLASLPAPGATIAASTPLARPGASVSGGEEMRSLLCWAC
jgi:hypothetical protein